MLERYSIEIYEKMFFVAKPWLNSRVLLHYVSLLLSSSRNPVIVLFHGLLLSLAYAFFVYNFEFSYFCCNFSRRFSKIPRYIHAVQFYKSSSIFAGDLIFQHYYSTFLVTGKNFQIVMSVFLEIKITNNFMIRLN